MIDHADVIMTEMHLPTLHRGHRHQHVNNSIVVFNTRDVPCVFISVNDDGSCRITNVDNDHPVTYDDADPTRVVVTCNDARCHDDGARNV
jgi:hypothetical protein